MTNDERIKAYFAQTGKPQLTPRQNRRATKRLNQLIGPASCRHKRVKIGTACTHKGCSNYAFGL